MITKQMTTTKCTYLGMLGGAAFISVDRTAAVATHVPSARVRIPGIPAWRPPVC